MGLASALSQGFLAKLLLDRFVRISPTRGRVRLLVFCALINVVLRIALFQTSNVLALYDVLSAVMVVATTVVAILLTGDMIL